MSSTSGTYGSANQNNRLNRKFRVAQWTDDKKSASSAVVSHSSQSTA
jgi:hypothetical protein